MHLLLAVVVSVIVHGTDTKMTVTPTKVTKQIVVTIKVVNDGKRSHIFGVAGKKFTIKPHHSRNVNAELGVGKVTLTWSGANSKTLTVLAAPISKGVVSARVDVDMFEYGYTLSQQSVRAGMIVFQLGNSGNVPHDFSILGVSNGRSTTISPGAAGTLTVTLTAGTYTYLCTIPGHADQGMTGTLRVFNPY